MGGTVQVQSERGRGSRFTLVLPFEACEGDACKLQLEESIEAERSDAAVSAVSCSGSMCTCYLRKTTRSSAR